MRPGWTRAAIAWLAFILTTSACDALVGVSNVTFVDATAVDATRDGGASAQEEAGARDATAKKDAASESGTGDDSGRDGGMDAAGLPNCGAGDGGVAHCGVDAESCCASSEVEAGTYDRTYDLTGENNPTDPASVSGFRLDDYLVTVGRFRQFVSAVNHHYVPQAGMGKHVHLNGSKGLNGGGDASTTYESGWLDSYDGNIGPTDVALDCGAHQGTWSTTVGNRENLPINCVNWFEAYAFCIWDGGFLPSEAEWEYAAAGGAMQRAYPWGSAAPAPVNLYAIYGCNYPTEGSACADSGTTNVAPVGITTSGTARWRQMDMAGEVWEWNLDWYAPTGYVTPCVDCADLATPPESGTTVPPRVFRGGNFINDASDLDPAYRQGNDPTDRSFGVGFRCARAP